MRNGASRKANSRGRVLDRPQVQRPDHRERRGREISDTGAFAEELGAHRDGHFGSTVNESTLQNSGHIFDGARGDSAPDDDRVACVFRD